MSEAAEITKTFTIATPTKPGYNGKPIGRDWMLSEVEDACWQARAAGAVDDTAVYLSYKGIEVKELPAWAIEIPPAMRRPSTRVEEAPQPPRMAWWRRVPWWAWVAVPAIPFVLPLLIAALSYAWSIA